MNKQPFYHAAEVLFTGVGVEMSQLEFVYVLKAALGKDFIDVQVEKWQDPEPGDPADLM